MSAPADSGAGAPDPNVAAAGDGQSLPAYEQDPEHVPPPQAITMADQQDPNTKIKRSKTKKRTFTIKRGKPTIKVEAADEEGNAEEQHGSSRQVYFGLPLPQEKLDEDGNPEQQFARNKIRTAKYTPLSFLPKNLWFQFHNLANIFFLFVVILVVSILPLRPCLTPVTRRQDDQHSSSSSPFLAVIIRDSTRCHSSVSSLLRP